MDRVIYMGTYYDDNGQKHISFVEGFSAVKFLEERFYTITYEVISSNVKLASSFALSCK